MMKMMKVINVVATKITKAVMMIKPMKCDFSNTYAMFSS